MSMEAAAAIVGTLRSDSALTAMLAGGVSGIALGLLNPGTKAPYVVVMDVAEVPSYVMGNNEAFSDERYDIYVYAQDDDDEAASTVAGRVQKAIFDALQNQDISPDGRRVMSLRRGGSRPSSVQSMSSEENYYRVGYEWELMTSPS